jgi:ADP-heptose:LPS heptosyltransferase
MKKIAIIRRNGLGDLVCIYPLIQFLKKNYPCSQITLFVDQTNASLTPYLEGHDEVVVIPKGNKYLQLALTALKYRGRRFDLAVSGKTSSMRLITFFLYLLGAKKTVACASGGWEDLLLTNPIKSFTSPTHQALKSIQMVAPQIAEISPEFFPKIAPLKEARSFIQDVPHGKLILLLSASTSRLTNRMDVEKYALLVNTLTKRFPLHPVIISMPDDASRAYALEQNIIGKKSLVFPRSFENFMLALSAADFLMVGDGGVGHIGAAMQKPVFTWFGESNPKEWLPLGRHVAALFHPNHVDEIEDKELQSTAEKLINEVLCE